MCYNVVYLTKTVQIVATIIYLHGFASIGTSAKSQALVDAFGQDSVYAPDLPFNPSEVIDLVTKLVTDAVAKSASYPVVFVGTSLGGFWANYFAQRFDAPCVIVNPSTDPAKSFAPRVGQTAVTYATGTEFEITQADIEQFAKCVDDTNKLQNGYLVNLFLAKDDDVIDYARTLSVIKHTNTTVVTEDGGHRFDKNWSMVIDRIASIVTSA